MAQGGVYAPVDILISDPCNITHYYVPHVDQNAWTDCYG